MCGKFLLRKRVRLGANEAVAVPMCGNVPIMVVDWIGAEMQRVASSILG